MEISFLTVSGVAETRVSPKAVSIGIKSLGKIKSILNLKTKTKRFEDQDFC